MTRKTAYLRRFRAVTFLHRVPPGVRTCAGLGLPEVIVAVTVLGAGILGVAAVGGAARKLAHMGAVRSAQTVAAAGTLENATVAGRGRLEVAVDTVGVSPGLIEIRVTVGGSGPAGDQEWVTRRALSGP